MFVLIVVVVVVVVVVFPPTVEAKYLPRKFAFGISLNATHAINNLFLFGGEC